MRTITTAQMIEMLRQDGSKGSTHATIQSATEPTLRVGPFKGNVLKLSRTNVTLNAIYGNAVNRQRVREGIDAEFKTHPRKWGERVVGTTLVEYKGKHYVETMVKRIVEKPTYVWKADRRPLSAEEIESMKTYMSKRKRPQRQGTDKEIIWRDYGAATIIALAYRGENLVVV